MKNVYIILAISILLIIGFTVDSEAQCAMCRAQLETGATAGPDAKNTGINSGILYLMLFPYIIIGSIAFMWYRSNQKMKAQVNA
jgi:hypothetical protein